MTTEYEYYSTGDDDWTSEIHAGYWRAQTFTVGATAHKVTLLKIKHFRIGSPGTGTISIKATDVNGHPTGDDLTSASVNGNALTTDTNGEWHDYSVPECVLSPNTKYAIVLKFPSGNDSNEGPWRSDASSPTYTAGNLEYTNNGGSTWAASTSDLMFEVWGDPADTSISASDSGIGADIASIGLSVADSGVGAESDPLIGLLGTDAGVGAEVVTTGAQMTVSDAGAGVESPTVQASVPSSDSGVGTETSVGVQNQLAPTDAGVGSETLGLSASVPVSETGTGLETPSMQASIPISDAAVGSELVSPTSSFTVVDSGLGLENVTTPGTLTVIDEGKGAEFAWRIKPTSPMIDALVLPHVQSLIISDVASMSDKKVQGGSLPRRKMVGKQGRTVTIEGWTDQQSDIDALEGLVDGVARTFYHPSGDSFAILVTAFNPDRRADARNRRTYLLTLTEQ